MTTVTFARVGDPCLNPPGVYKIGMAGRGGCPETLERLSPDGYFLMPMIAADGSSVVFWGREEGETGFNIWRNDLDGKGPVRLTDSRAVSGHPFWSADASRIVFFSTVGVSAETEWTMAAQFRLDRAPRNLWIMNRDGGEQRRLTDGAHIDERPCITPDGETVVFVSDRSGSLNLWSVSTATGELKQLTRHRGLDYRPAFSPDGEHLAFFTDKTPRRNHDLCVLRWPDGRPEFPLPGGRFQWVHGPFWLADGRSVLFHARSVDSGEVALWIVNLDSQRLERIDVPGVPIYTHGSLDAQEGVLTFDTQTK